MNTAPHFDIGKLVSGIHAICPFAKTWVSTLILHSVCNSGKCGFEIV